jgi:hypothetical protein
MVLVAVHPDDELPEWLTTRGPIPPHYDPKFHGS